MSTVAPDISDLCIALSDEGAGFRWYFDVETQETVLLNHEYDPREHGGVTAEQVVSDSGRFKRIPSSDDSQTWADMEAFTAECPDARLRESLELALSAPGPERRFRAALGWLPDQLKKWHQFRQHRLETRAREWLKSVGVSA